MSRYMHSSDAMIALAMALHGLNGEDDGLALSNPDFSDGVHRLVLEGHLRKSVTIGEDFDLAQMNHTVDASAWNWLPTHRGRFRELRFFLTKLEAGPTERWTVNVVASTQDLRRNSDRDHVVLASGELVFVDQQAQSLVLQDFVVDWLEGDRQYALTLQGGRGVALGCGMPWLDAREASTVSPRKRRFELCTLLTAPFHLEFA